MSKNKITKELIKEFTEKHCKNCNSYAFCAGEMLLAFCAGEIIVACKKFNEFLKEKE